MDRDPTEKEEPSPAQPEQEPSPDQLEKEYIKEDFGKKAGEEVLPAVSDSEPPPTKPPDDATNRPNK